MEMTSTDAENIRDTIEIVEKFEKLSKQERQQCLIYISALADRHLYEKVKEQ